MTNSQNKLLVVDDEEIFCQFMSGKLKSPSRIVFER